MFKRIIKNMRKSGKLGHALALGLALSVGVGSSAFALNSGYLPRPLSFTGYEYVSTTAIDVFFDQQIVSTTGNPVIPQSYFIDKSLFSLKKHATLSNPVNPDSITIDTSASDGTDSDTTDAFLPYGTRMRLVFDTPLTADTLYDLTISGLLLDSDGISLGNYSKGQDFKFTLRTPVSGTTWSSTAAPYVTFSVGAPGATSNVSWESNAKLIFDRPLSTGSLSSFLSTLSDSSHFVNNTASAGVVANNEAFTADANDKRSLANTFYFPETKQIGPAIAKNRNQASDSYTLTIPSFTDYNGNTWTSFTNSLSNSAVTSFSFTTNSTDYAGWENTGYPLVYLNTGMAAWTRDDATHITVYFPSNITFMVTPAPASYDIYYALDSGNNKYTTSAYTFTSGNNVAYTGASTLSKQIAIPIGTSTNKFWIRVVPKNSDGTPMPSGFSVTQQASL